MLRRPPARLPAPIQISSCRMSAVRVFTGRPGWD